MAKSMDRESVVSTIHAAQVAGRLDFARSLAIEWLAIWPGDTELALQLAAIELKSGATGPVIDRLSLLVEVDPESQPAYEMLAEAYKQTGDSLRIPVYIACAKVLASEQPNPASSPSWAVALARAYKALDAGEAAEALRASNEALAADPSFALPALVAVRASLASGATREAVHLAEASHDRWPHCVAFNLILAESQLSSDRSAVGVESMHQVAAADPLGVVAETVLGIDHPYRSLWPVHMQAQISRPIPDEIMAVMGASAKFPKSDVSSIPIPEPGEAFQGPNSGEQTVANEALIAVRNEFDRLAQRLNARRTVEGQEARLPAYIVLTSHTRLVQEIGPSGFRRVNEAIMNLVEVVRRKSGWGAYRIYIDDPRSLQPFGLKPCDPGNAWQIKLRLADLDRALAERGEMIGAVLIVGGHNIIPFHLLPNPTDDDDDSVPSDNPYAATDENYFAPEWPVGRLPIDSDTDLLVKLISIATAAHREQLRSRSSPKRFGVWLRNRFGRFFRPQPNAIGYSASIWRKASLAVFRAIGTPRSLITSPPNAAGNMPSVVNRPSPLSYFNLHGLQDSPEWYGQRDPLRDVSDTVEFPVALRPEDVVNSGRAPRIVFTEACYGAHAIGKTEETALSLKFLASGSQAVVGSTMISYGSVTPPLIAADLLGRLFWDQLRQSVPIGEALRLAKLKLAAEMLERQGFLDGEDQKTLISFVLYGDPLLTSQLNGRSKRSKVVIRVSKRPASMKTACALGGPDLHKEKSYSPTTDRVHSIVAQYLPTLTDAEWSLRNQHRGCDHDDHCCPSQQIGAKTVGENEAVVVTLSKQVRDGSKVHPHFAQMTLDEGGKVIKLAVSR
ncbi:MAG: C25 family cysteine peptidase [Anaerolineales bacterium]